MLATLHFLKIGHFWKINIDNKMTLAMDKLKKTHLLYTITLTVEKKDRFPSVCYNL